MPQQYSPKKLSTAKTSKSYASRAVYLPFGRMSPRAN